jgi:DNA-binding transcriptional MerR regulator
MRISELSDLTGVPAATLKYYLREQLVPAGVRRSGNQTDYGDEHVRRVRLVRALLETGGLSIADARRVLATLDEEPAHTFAAAQHALGVGRARTGGAETSARALARVAELADARGWRTTPDNPGLEVAARVLDDFDAIGFEPADDYLAAYAEAAERVARADVAALRDRESPESAAELMIVGTVVGDALAAGLRRLAHQDATAELFPVTGDGSRPRTSPTPPAPREETA